jgi:AraC family transcriptional regulator
MDVQIIIKDKIKIAGLTVKTLLKETREQLIIPRLQQEFNQRINEIQGTIGVPITYGVFIDPPNYKPDTDLFTWIAGVEVGEDIDLPQDMIRYEIPSNKYAVLHYEGDIDNAGSAYDALYNGIKKSEYKISNTYGFEMYTSIHSVFERKQANFKLHFPIVNK